MKVYYTVFHVFNSVHYVKIDIYFVVWNSKRNYGYLLNIMMYIVHEHARKINMALIRVSIVNPVLMYYVVAIYTYSNLLCILYIMKYHAINRLQIRIGYGECAILNENAYPIYWQAAIFIGTIENNAL